MARILVIGGAGFYGGKVVELLRSDHEVTIGSRRRGREGAVEVDLGRPETFANFAGFDLLINCSDSVHAPPDAAILHVLRCGGTWLEMGADAVATERLLALPIPEPCVGAGIVGVGVFPGISTALARSVVERGPSCATLELGIRLSPLSGAGKANCALMAESLFVPAVAYREGRRVAAATALGELVRLEFLRDGAMISAPASTVALPDTALVHRSCPTVANLSVHFALVPSWLRFNFAALARLAAWFRFAKRPLAWLITWQMILVRAWLLRGVESRVELVALADRGRASERWCALSFADGQTSTALGVAAAVEAWLGASERRPGLLAVAEAFTLEQLLAALERRGQAPALRRSDAG